MVIRNDKIHQAEFYQDYLNENPGLDKDSNKSNENSEELRKSTITMATSEEETKNQQHVTDFTFKNITTCPDCGSSVMHEGGCVTCPGCGFSKCE